MMTALTQNTLYFNKQIRWMRNFMFKFQPIFSARIWWKTKLRPGNVYTSNRVVEFYNEKFPETTPCLRGNSDFAIPVLYEFCEK